MKKCILSLLLLTFSVVAVNAQSTGRIARAFAFYTETLPGNIPVDENGNRMDPGPTIERFIYIEVRGTAKPKITKVLYSGVPYTAVVVPAEPNTIDVGKTYKDGKQFVLKPRKYYRYWKVQLENVSGKKAPAPGVKRIIIYARNGTVNYTFPLYSETKLLVPDRY